MRTLGISEKDLPCFFLSFSFLSFGRLAKVYSVIIIINFTIIHIIRATAMHGALTGVQRCVNSGEALTLTHL